MITKRLLTELYVENGESLQAIANKIGYSRRGVDYWIKKHGIPIRTVSEAIYLWHNPDGDPFKFRFPTTKEEMKLFGIGIGLYWGEGTKSCKSAIRLGNTDPLLIKYFIDFLVTFFGINTKELKFGLQIFSDLDKEKVLDFWIKRLKVQKKQFQKPIVTKSGSIGTYRRKSEYGVVTVHYNNKKARDILVNLLPM